MFQGGMLCSKRNAVFQTERCDLGRNVVFPAERCVADGTLCSQRTLCSRWNVVFHRERCVPGRNVVLQTERCVPGRNEVFQTERCVPSKTLCSRWNVVFQTERCVPGRNSFCLEASSVTCGPAFTFRAFKQTCCDVTSCYTAVRSWDRLLLLAKCCRGQPPVRFVTRKVVRINRGLCAQTFA